MAESVVSFLVEKISFLLEEEVKLISRFREEVKSVKAELESMSAFLRAADTVEDEDEEIKVWVKQVREAAFDAEDILDEYLYQFAEQHQRRQGFYGCLLKIAHKVKILKARRKIAPELRSIKSRVNDISNRRKRYQYKSNIILQTGSSSSTYTKCTWQQRRSDALLLQESQLVGIGGPKQKLVNWLLKGEPSNLQLVAMVGMGGLGKTTLVNQVYIDANVKEHFKHRAWLTVSQSFNPCELLQKIIQQLYVGINQPLPQGAHSSDRHDLFQIICNFLSEERYLIVLDDVWGVNAWNDLKYAFPNNNRCSRLMLTTRIVDVGATATKDLLGDNIYPLKTLSPEESWNLFCERTFQGRSCPQHLMEISEHILKRCMGLPLAIVTISGVLATKDTNKVHEWEMVRRCLGADFESHDELKNLKKILSLSFNDLSYRLKSCFLYLSIFPEDWTFRKNYVTKLWAVEGFVQEMEDSTLEEVGELYFNELCNRSLIQVVNEETFDVINSFKIHDIVREIILQKSKDQNFATIVGGQNLMLPERVRHLSMSTTLENLQGDPKFSGLRSLIFFNAEGMISSISMSALFSKFGGLRLLKVLECERLPLDIFPECITKLYNLRHLNLSRSKVASIPSSIGRLRNLETLHMGETLVKELPDEILQLHRLHHIMVFHKINDASLFANRNGASVPKEIGKLRSLQTLYTIQVSEEDVDLIVSLGNLRQLRTLHVQQLGAEHGATLCSSIEKLSHLRELRMERRKEAEILDVQGISSPPQCLERLYMYGRLEMLPHWVHKLSSLVILSLRWSKLQVDPLESLQALPNLQKLAFENVYDGEELCFKAGGFQMLKHLAICSFGRLSQVKMEEGTMPRLKKLWLEDCKLLKEVPSGIEFLTHLYIACFLNMGDQLITRLSSRSQNSDLSRVEHVRTVFIGSRDAQGPRYERLVQYGVIIEFEA